jgi:calcium-dependent protein kinase
MFSAGLIFHILLFGKSIFPGKNYNEVLAQNRACDYNLDQKQYLDLGSETYDLLKRMLDKNPSTRINAN